MNHAEHLLLNLIKSNNLSIQESKVLPGEIEPYWHSSILDSTGFPVGGGYSKDRMTARKIALAEYVERTTVKKYQDEVGTDWGFEFINSACGFAVGFDEAKTKYRSLKEGIERWVMSLWIDEGYQIDEVNFAEIKHKLSPASIYFLNNFDDIKFYYKKINVFIGGHLLEISVAQTMGLKDKGIYPGSSTQYSNGCVWEHALLESFRHLRGTQNNPLDLTMFPDNKVYYFSTHADVALKQISAATKKSWPNPKVKFHKTKKIDELDAYLSRTIIDGWRCWSEGEIERFLY